MFISNDDFKIEWHGGAGVTTPTSQQEGHGSKETEEKKSLVVRKYFQYCTRYSSSIQHKCRIQVCKLYALCVVSVHGRCSIVQR